MRQIEYSNENIIITKYVKF